MTSHGIPKAVADNTENSAAPPSAFLPPKSHGQDLPPAESMPDIMKERDNR
jgi:hypothetical protein